MNGQGDSYIPPQTLFVGLEIKDTTDTIWSASFIDIHLEIASEGRLRKNLYDTRDYYNFPIVNFPFICSKIPVAPVYRVYIPHLIRYFRACGSYQDSLDRRLLLTTRKLLNQEFLLVNWSHYFTVATITWLIVTEYLCRKCPWTWICSTCR